MFVLCFCALRICKAQKDNTEHGWATNRSFFSLSIALNHIMDFDWNESVNCYNNMYKPDFLLLWSSFFIFHLSFGRLLQLVCFFPHRFWNRLNKFARSKLHIVELLLYVCIMDISCSSPKTFLKRWAQHSQMLHFS